MRGYFRPAKTSLPPLCLGVFRLGLPAEAAAAASTLALLGHFRPCSGPAAGPRATHAPRVVAARPLCSMWDEGN